MKVQKLYFLMTVTKNNFEKLFKSLVNYRRVLNIPDIYKTLIFYKFQIVR
jgi:hypothetical protein